MPRLVPLLAGLSLSLSMFLSGAQAATAPYQIVGCVVAQLEGNSGYYGTATTATKLKCEFTNPEYYPTLQELYQQGWRLISVLGDNQAISMGGRGPSPLYLLEREAPPASAAASAPPEDPKKKTK